MKKRFLSLTLMTIIAWTTMMAVTINDIRVYVNPGHGCWMTRNLPLVNKALKDTTGFHESNTNLWKAFGLMEKLIEWGVPFDRTLNQSGSHHQIGAARSFKNNIVFSRVKNTPWYGDDTEELYNRNLTEVAAEANYNDFDYFISIHSNAYQDGTNTNYMTLFYNDNVSTSYNSAKAAGWYLLENPHQMWTHYASSPDLRAGSSGYEVLASLNVPGYMSEGFFHTYQPARHKIMNPAVARIEGIGYAKGINDYFSLGKKDSYGMIYGILRHATETFSHTYYTPNTGTLDKYKPINGATVKLKKDGNVVQTVVTDNFYNGAFVFDKVAPGNYTVECSHPDYATSSFSVTVEANKIVYPTASISSEGMSFVPVQGAYAYGHTLSKSGDNYVFSYKATATAPKASIILTNKSTGAKTTHDAGKVSKGNNSVTISAANIGEGEYTWAVSIANEESTAAQAFFNQGGTTENNRRGGVAIDLDTESKYFGHVYTTTGYAGGLQRYNPDLSKNGGVLHADKFSGSTSSSPYRIKISNSKAYISDWSDENSGVYVYNPDNGSLNQMFQGSRASSGQWTNGGAVVGGSTTGIAFYNAGSERRMYAFCEDYTSGRMLLRYHLGNNDTWGAAPSATFATVTNNLGHNNVEMVTCEKGVWICQNLRGTNSTQAAPAFMFMDHNGNIKLSSYNLGGLEAITQSPESGIAISDDMTCLAVGNSGGNVSIYKVTWNGDTPSLSYQYAVEVGSTTDIEQIAFDPADNLLLFSRQQGLMAFTLRNPARNTVTNAPASQAITGSGSTPTPEPEPEPEPETPSTNRGAFAYGFKTEPNGELYKLTYSLTDNVKGLDIVFTNIETGEVTSIDVSSIPSLLAKGECVALLEAGDLPIGSFTWGVAVHNSESVEGEVLYNQGGVTSNNRRGGVTIDLDSESPYFGHVYSSVGYAEGVQAYLPNLTKNGGIILTDKFSTGTSSSPYRIKANSGKLYLSDWSDGNSGIYVYNPANSAFAQIFQGSRASSGQWTNGSAVVGGSSTCVDFWGTGSERYMYTFCEDYSTGKKLIRYKLGTADTWNVAPTYVFDGISGYLASSNVEVAVCDKGVWICQNYMGTNHTEESKPTFLFMDHSGNLKFNAYSLGTANNMTEAPEGGIAINKAMTKLAVANDNYGNINIYDVTWNGNVPSLKFSYEIKVNHAQTNYAGIEQMMFDPADNLLVFSRQYGFMAFTMKNPARKSLTVAPSSQVLEIKTTGIEDITINEAPVEYYNLQGVKVANPSNGIFIKKQGDKISKIFIK